MTKQNYYKMEDLKTDFKTIHNAVMKDSFIGMLNGDEIHSTSSGTWYIISYDDEYMEIHLQVINHMQFRVAERGKFESLIVKEDDKVSIALKIHKIKDIKIN